MTESWSVIVRGQWYRENTNCRRIYGKCSENQNILYHDHGGNYRNYIFVKTINCTLKRVNFILLNYPLKVIVKENN